MYVVGSSYVTNRTNSTTEIPNVTLGIESLTAHVFINQLLFTMILYIYIRMCVAIFTGREFLC